MEGYVILKKKMLHLQTLCSSMMDDIHCKFKLTIFNCIIKHTKETCKKCVTIYMSVETKVHEQETIFSSES